MLTPGLCLALLAPLPQNQPTPSVHPAETSVRVVVHGQTGLVEQLLQHGFAATSYPPLARGRSAAEVMLDVRRLPALHRVAGKAKVMVMEYSRPLREIEAERRRAAGPDAPDGRYHTPAEIAAELLALQTRYPTLARRFDLNTRYGVPLTHNGRHIYGLRISDNPASDEDEPAMLLVSNHHCRELNTIVLALHSAQRILSTYSSDAGIKKLVDENEIWIVPTMNPDGLDFVWTNNNMWRKNRRRNSSTSFGVDLNRNYPYFWSRCGSSTNPGSDLYHGPSAGSEPETKVMLALGRAEVFERMLDVHSYSRDVRYGYNRLTGPRLPAGFKAYLDKIQAEVATAMRYRVNTSCCCGGDQHWHLAENGTLAYLAEMDTAFQPSWAQTQIEIQRVYTGVKFFFQRPVPLRGHIRSLAGNRPLAAEFEVIGAPLIDGQKRRSSPRHGRYAAWLATGTYNLRFTAVGHVSKTITVRLVDGQTKNLDVTLLPTLGTTTLALRGTPKLGTTVALDLLSANDAKLPYAIGAAFGSSPGIKVGPRNVPLNNDALLNSMFQMTSVFANAIGTLSATGTGTMYFHVPAIPDFAGLRLHFCGLSIDHAWPSSVKGISNAVATTLVR